jgi:hypothetical protein
MIIFNFTNSPGTSLSALALEEPDAWDADGDVEADSLFLPLHALNKLITRIIAAIPINERLIISVYPPLKYGQAIYIHGCQGLHELAGKFDWIQRHQYQAQPNRLPFNRACG